MVHGTLWLHFELSPRQANYEHVLLTVSTPCFMILNCPTNTWCSGVRSCEMSRWCIGKAASRMWIWKFQLGYNKQSMPPQGCHLEANLPPSFLSIKVPAHWWQLSTLEHTEHIPDASLGSLATGTAAKSNFNANSSHFSPIQISVTAKAALGLTSYMLMPPFTEASNTPFRPMVNAWTFGEDSRVCCVTRFRKSLFLFSIMSIAVWMGLSWCVSERTTSNQRKMPGRGCSTSSMVRSSQSVWRTCETKILRTLVCTSSYMQERWCGFFQFKACVLHPPWIHFLGPFEVCGRVDPAGTCSPGWPGRSCGHSLGYSVPGMQSWCWAVAWQAESECTGCHPAWFALMAARQSQRW